MQESPWTRTHVQVVLKFCKENVTDKNSLKPDEASESELVDCDFNTLTPSIWRNPNNFYPSSQVKQSHRSKSPSPVFFTAHGPVPQALEFTSVSRIGLRNFELYGIGVQKCLAEFTFAVRCRLMENFPHPIINQIRIMTAILHANSCTDGQNSSRELQATSLQWTQTMVVCRQQHP